MIKNTIIRFKDDEPVTVTLVTDPTAAKSYTKDTQWGPKTSFGYLCKGNQMFFASEVLHSKLQDFRKGDTLTINLVEKRWVISSSSERQESTGIQNVLEDTKNNILLNKLVADMEEVKAYIRKQENGQNNAEAAKVESYPKDEEINF